MHCIHGISPTIYNTASTVSVSSQPLYLWSLNNCMYDITPTLYMTSYAPYTTWHPLFDVDVTLWVPTIVVTTLYPLHSWHHTHYIWHHTHDNTKVISAISPPISDTTSTVSVSSNPVYQLFYTHSLYDVTHSMFDITFSMHDITWTLYDITPV